MGRGERRQHREPTFDEYSNRDEGVGPTGTKTRTGQQVVGRSARSGDLRGDGSDWIAPQGELAKGPPGRQEEAIDGQRPASNDERPLSWVFVAQVFFDLSRHDSSCLRDEVGDELGGFVMQCGADSGSVVGAAEASEVGDDGGTTLGVGLDVVVLEEGSGPTARVTAFGVRFVDDALLAAGRGAAAGAGIDRLTVGVDDQQRNKRVR